MGTGPNPLATGPLNLSGTLSARVSRLTPVLTAPRGTAVPGAGWGECQTRTGSGSTQATSAHPYTNSPCAWQESNRVPILGREVC